MKKSKFGNLNFDSVETLSRAELKKVTGGYSTGGGGDGGCAKKTCKWQTYDMNEGKYIEHTGNCTSTELNGTCMWVCPGSATCYL